MADDIIKNPARQKTIQRDSYTPEYIRLGRDPVVNQVNPAEFAISRKKRRQQMPVEPGPMGPIPRASGTSFDLQQDTNDEIEYDEVPNPPSPIEYDLMTDDAEEDEEQEVEESDHLDDEKKTETDETHEFQIPDVAKMEPGQYCVYVCGVMVAQGLDREEAELIIQRILCDESMPFTDINVNTDVILMKRIPIRVGVLALE